MGMSKPLIKSAWLGMAVGWLTVQAEFKVVGYLPNWGNAIQSVQYDKLTHVIWSFAAPENDGSITGFEGEKLKQLVTAAHAKKVKVFLALGGGSNQDKGWDVATASDAGRKALVKSCMDAVHAYNLDGIDFDWEYPDGAQVAGFNATVTLLSAALHAEGKQISAAVTMNDWPKSFPTRELYDSFDFLNIMIYDNPAPHSTIAHVNTALDVWIKTKGLPKEKFITGCPFYGPGGKYKDIVAANPAAAMVDNNGSEGYNSIPTLKKKTEIAVAKSGGIMFWELSQDATGSLSLLSAVHEVVVKSGVTGIRTLAPGADPARAPGAFHRGAGAAWNGRGVPLFLLSGTVEAGILRVDPSGRLRLHAGSRTDTVPSIPEQ